MSVSSFWSAASGAHELDSSGPGAHHGPNATAIIPSVAAQQIARSWCGLEAECFDGVPLIGPAPGFDGLYLALGFSGHGFQLAPAVGRAVADEMMGEQDDALAGLRPERMLGFDPAALATFLTGPDARSEMR